MHYKRTIALWLMWPVLRWCIASIHRPLSKQAASGHFRRDQTQTCPIFTFPLAGSIKCLCLSVAMFVFGLAHSKLQPTYWLNVFSAGEQILLHHAHVKDTRPVYFLGIPVGSCTFCANCQSIKEKRVLGGKYFSKLKLPFLAIIIIKIIIDGNILIRYTF